MNLDIGKLPEMKSKLGNIGLIKLEVAQIQTFLMLI
jgi:hypothetical protein